MRWIDLYQAKLAADMKENFIKQVLSTDFYSPMFWESIIKKTFDLSSFSAKYPPEIMKFRWVSSLEQVPPPARLGSQIKALAIHK